MTGDSPTKGRGTAPQTKRGPTKDREEQAAGPPNGDQAARPQSRPPVTKFWPAKRRAFRKRESRT